MTGGNDSKDNIGEFADVALRDYRDAVNRRRWLFLGVSIFLIVDAVVFFIALCWASYSIVCRGGDWHLYASALLPGALGAVVSVMALKAVFRVPQQDGLRSEDLAPGLETWKGAVGDLSGE